MGRYGEWSSLGPCTCLRSFFVPPRTCWNSWISDFSMFCLTSSIPGALSRSKHYVGKVGEYHKISICTLNPPNASPWIETCPFLSIGVGPSSPIHTVCYYTNGFCYHTNIKKGPFYEKGPACQEHSRDEHRIWVEQKQNKKRLGSHFKNSYEWSH